ncbi:MAG: tyrosine-type recombinase/integrase [Thermoplasmata archaeon]
MVHEHRSVVMTRTDDVVERWFASKRERACVPATIVQYRWIVRRALAFLATDGRTTDPSAWTVEDARWLRHRLKEDPWQLSILADLARFSRNTVFHEVGLPRPRQPTRVRWLREEQVRGLLEVTRNDPLLRLVILFGLGQGLRRIEWLRLRVGDIDLAGNRLLVRGKGRAEEKRVWMGLHPALPTAIHDYLEWRNRRFQRYLRRFPHTPLPEELFIHRNGQRYVPYGKGGTSRWMNILQRRLAARGITVKLSTHMLRRSGATLMERTLLRNPELARDGVYRAVQGFLRHESIATTMRYLEADPSRQAAAMQAFADSLPWADPVPPPEAAALGRARARRPEPAERFRSGGR